MKVVEYLKKCSKNGLEPFEQLKSEHDIKFNHHGTEPLTILNYCMIKSPKTEPIVQECRGLVVHSDTFEVIARPFRRFFNLGECAQYAESFDWDSMEAMSKEDGSLIILYHWNGQWRTNTRNSFGDGLVQFTDYTWRDMFFQAVEEKQLKFLNHDYTYCFELVSPYNKIVRQYPDVKAILLAVFDTSTGVEANSSELECTAEGIGAEPVKMYSLGTIDEIQAFLKEQETKDPTFEGFVIKDKHSNRWKIKSATYVALHHMRGNDNIFNPKHLLPFILTGESDEVLTYFPEAKEVHDKMQFFCNVNLLELHTIYDKYKDVEDQKEFAIAVKGNQFSGILFRARKTGEAIEDIWRDSADMILKVYK